MRGSARISVALAILGFAVSFSVSPPPQSAEQASAATYTYKMGTLDPNVKASSGTKPSISGGYANFNTVGHYYNIRTENIYGAIKQTTTTSGQAADMVHSPVSNYFSLCWWTPWTPGNWSSLNALCNYYS